MGYGGDQSRLVGYRAIAMKKRAFKKHRKRVKKLADKWLFVLGLKWWHVIINYHDALRGSEQVEGQETVMSTSVQWQYVQATIDVYVPTVAAISNVELERAFVHECMHILVAEMREDDLNVKHEERVCELLSKAVMWVEELL